MTGPGAVILDFGGVIWDMRWDVARALEAEHGLPRGSVFSTLYRSAEWEAVQRGRGDGDGWRQAAHRALEAMAGRSLPAVHELAGAVFGREPRIIRIDDVRLDLPPKGILMMTRHQDRPGVLGQIGSILGKHQINIQRLELAPSADGGPAHGFLTLTPEPTVTPIPTEPPTPPITLPPLTPPPPTATEAPTEPPEPTGQPSAAAS